jgi:hypothetical protein
VTTQNEEKISLSLYEKVKHSWGREVYTSCYTTQERKKERKKGSGMAWFRLGIWKIQRVWEDREKGLLHVEDESESHLMLKFPEMHRWTEELLNN